MKFKNTNISATNTIQKKYLLICGDPQKLDLKA